jgi:hypothetical protein
MFSACYVSAFSTLSEICVSPVLRWSILLLATDTPKRAEPEITEDKTERYGDGYPADAGFAFLVLGIFASEGNASDSGHRKENKASDLQPKLVQYASKGAQCDTASLQDRTEGPAFPGLAPSYLGKNSEFPG